MQTLKSIELAGRCVELVALCAGFQARFGRRSSLAATSTSKEWEMHRAILDKQVEIAALLEPGIVGNPGESLNQWWKRQQVIDLGIAEELNKEAARLVACCAYLEADDIEQWSYSVHASQAAIASRLHPMARQQAMSEGIQSAV
jgi:hypothetical protein